MGCWRSNRSGAIIAFLSAIWLCRQFAICTAQDISSVAAARLIKVDDHFGYQASPVTGSAVFSIEIITREMIAGIGGPRAPSFYVDRELPEGLRAHLGDYQKSGDDAGHLAPDADAIGDEAKRARSRLTNVVPQDPSLNRGLWRTLESHVLSLAATAERVIVVTMPIYRVHGDEGPKLVGTLVRPTHLAKAVLMERPPAAGGDHWEMFCWIIPNAPPPVGATIDDFRATVDEAEALTQLDLFGTLLDDETEIRLEAMR